MVEDSEDERADVSERRSMVKQNNHHYFNRTVFDDDFKSRKQHMYLVNLALIISRPSLEVKALLFQTFLKYFRV